MINTHNPRRNTFSSQPQTKKKILPNPYLLGAFHIHVYASENKLCHHHIMSMGVCRDSTKNSHHDGSISNSIVITFTFVALAHTQPHNRWAQSDKHFLPVATQDSREIAHVQCQDKTCCLTHTAKHTAHAFSGSHEEQQRTHTSAQSVSSC